MNNERSIGDGSPFHQADLDRVQRKLSSTHVQMCASHLLCDFDA